MKYILLAHNKHVAPTLIARRGRCRGWVRNVVDVGELGLEPLEAAVAAVVHHDGDNHSAKKGHHQHARQGT